jgi:hypothetical protein
MDVLSVYQTSQNRGTFLSIPIYGEGFDQWLGDAYYFWQDREFALQWGFDKKCDESGNAGTKFDVYTCELHFDSIAEEMIDTVFNQEDYENFVRNIERFAKRYSDKFGGKKPNLQQFNSFIKDFKIWQDIKAIRFQDLPQNDRKDYLKVSGFFYKKRIQIAVYDRKIIQKFCFHLQKKCQ